MIKNIVFDMGNVLIFFRPTEYVASLGRDAEASEMLLENVFRSEEWLHLDDGSMTDEEVIASMMKRLPDEYEGDVRKLVMEWDNPLLPVPGMDQLVKELKEKGFNIYLLSNAGTRQHEYWNRIPGSEYFDGTVISADIKMVKPEERIYKYLFEKFSILPEESVFIDDNEANINASCSLGMKGILFDGDAEKLKEKLAGLLQ